MRLVNQKISGYGPHAHLTNLLDHEFQALSEFINLGTLHTQSWTWSAKPVQIEVSVLVNELINRSVQFHCLENKLTNRSVQSYDLEDELSNRSVQFYRLEDELTNRSIQSY
jgi:hypothetical protein